MMIELTGLDGQNPLGYLASLGLLRVLDDDARRRQAAPPRLRWGSEGYTFPVLVTDLDVDRVMETVLDDARAQADNRALTFAYTKEGREADPADDDAVRDLKPPPEIARTVLDECATRPRRVSGLIAGFFSDLVQDTTKGNTKPTAFHFTAGQQLFLAMVEELRRGIDRDDVVEALIGPWLNASTLPSLSWDASAVRSYALRADDPSKEKRGSIPAANWLAVIALELFPVVPIGVRLVTTAVTGGWKDSAFRWPLWNVPVTFFTAASLLRVDPRRWTGAERDALGISEVYASSISRSDQGGYGSFSPASVVLPAGLGRRRKAWKEIAAKKS